MAHARTEYTSKSAKTAAENVRQRFAAMGQEIKLGQAYEILAAAAGYRNWPTMKADIDKTDNQPTVTKSAKADLPRAERLAMLTEAAIDLGLYPAEVVDLTLASKRFGNDPLALAKTASLARDWGRDRQVNAMYEDFFSDWIDDPRRKDAYQDPVVRVYTLLDHRADGDKDIWRSSTTGMTITRDRGGKMTLEMPEIASESAFDPIAADTLKSHDTYRIAQAVASRWIEWAAVTIGLGFHPDTPAEDYRPGLPAEIRKEYDLMIGCAHGLQVDPYSVGYSAWERTGLIAGGPKT